MGQEEPSQRWKKRLTRLTPSVLILSSCANFLDFHNFYCTILRIFYNFVVLKILQFFCTFLH